jgi:hypothetical protein
MKAPQHAAGILVAATFKGMAEARCCQPSPARLSTIDNAMKNASWRKPASAVELNEAPRTMPPIGRGE